MPTRPVVRARGLRKSQTGAEARLWRIVRGRGFEALKFRRQVPIGNYVADFACLERRLIIELDGGIHDAPFYDREAQNRREAWFLGQGFRLLRFTNSEVETYPNRVLQRLLEALGGG